MFWSALPEPTDRSPQSDFWFTNPAAGTTAGLRVDADRSLALPAVYAAVQVIAHAVSQIPLILYRRLANDGKERATDHPLFPLLHDQPNEHQTSSEWLEVMQHHVLLRGNSYSEIIADTRGTARELSIPFHPDAVKLERMRLSNGRRGVRYIVKEDGTEVPLSEGDVLHMRGLALARDGLSGLSPIDIEREAVGTGLAAQEFINRFYQNDAQPGGWIEHPTNFKDDEQKTKFRQSFQEAHTGVNRHRAAVFEYGMKWHPLDLKLVDAQFIESRKYTNLDIARIFRVPPHLIMELDRATFSNITQQDIEFVKFTMLPWLVRWEKRLGAWLLKEQERDEFFFEFLVDGLERGDGEARSRFYHFAIGDGWMAPNEARRKENLNPIDGLDEPRVPLNMGDPGGDNEERLEAMKFNAAEALAKTQRNVASNSDDPETFLRNDWRRVRKYMHCPTSDAQRYSDFVANLHHGDSTVGLAWPDWEARSIRLLMEMT